mgnify:CR=1 FL=1
MKKTVQIISGLFLIFFLTSCSEREIKEYENTEAMVEDAKSKVEFISAEDFKTVLESEDKFKIVDCREETEYDSACIPGAINIPKGLIEFQIGNKVSRREDLYIYCSNGDRSSLVAATLPLLKFSSVKVIEAGFDGWKEKYPDLIELEPAGAGAEDHAPAASSGGCGG